jgi:hypothetical protein
VTQFPRKQRAILRNSEKDEMPMPKTGDNNIAGPLASAHARVDLKNSRNVICGNFKSPLRVNVVC